VKIYEHIWTPEGSPYTLHSQGLEAAVAQALVEDGHDELLVRMAHRYGNPSMETELRNFKSRGIEHVVVLPLYPQQAYAPTGAVHDELELQLKTLEYAPKITFIEDYHTDALWVEAVANSIRPYLDDASRTGHLVFSFHSVPLKDLRHGDPYKQQVEASCALIAKALGLEDDAWTIAFQSRFDDAQRWLGPFLPTKMAQLSDSGVENSLVVCPGFAVDCTETLYDIALHLKIELNAEGHTAAYTYIPCLNESAAHAKALAQIVENQLKR
jgi:ferrochelatase